MSLVIQSALSNLELSKYSWIKKLLGELLQRRAKQVHSNCGIFIPLAQQSWVMETFNEECGTYLNEIGLDDSLRKLRDNVGGHVKRPASEFTQVLGDFMAEISAVNVLKRKNFARFRAIHHEQPDGSTSDYAAQKAGAPAYIEVKNLRVNDTVVDIANEELRRLYAADPSSFPFHVAFTFFSDEPPSAEQERRIRNRIRTWAGRIPPFTDSFDLVTGDASCQVLAGEGSAMGLRGWNFGDPPTIDGARFIARVRAKAEQAKSQMGSFDGLKVLVINLNPPSFDITGELLEAATTEVTDVFNGDVEPHFLLRGTCLPQIGVEQP